MIASAVAAPPPPTSPLSPVSSLRGPVQDAAAAAGQTPRRVEGDGGRHCFEDGGQYCGSWLEGRAHGYGVCTGPRGQGEYAGAWSYGLETSGTYTWPNGHVYAGEWSDGRRHGVGAETHGRWLYQGEWTAGLKGRYGVRHSTVSGARYEGTWVGGMQDGFGVETYADQSTYQGQWMRGQRHGFGVRQSAPFDTASPTRDHHEVPPGVPRAQLAPSPSPPPPPSRNDSTPSLNNSVAGGPGGQHQERGRSVERSRAGFALTASRSDDGRSATLERQGNGGASDGLRKQEPPPQRRSRSASLRRTIVDGLSRLGRRKKRDTSSIGDLTQQATSSRLSPVSSPPGECERLDGLPPGTGDLVETYMGEWRADKRSGYGISQRSDGLRYSGEWYNDKKSGYGATYYPDGRPVEQGKYKDNLLVTDTTAASKKLFALRPSKVRERVSAAVTQARKAAETAALKADVASSRRTTAKVKAELAERSAQKAQNDAAMARVVAEKFGRIAAESEAVAASLAAASAPLHHDNTAATGPAQPDNIRPNRTSGGASSQPVVTQQSPPRNKQVLSADALAPPPDDSSTRLHSTSIPTLQNPNPGRLEESTANDSNASQRTLRPPLPSSSDASPPGVHGGDRDQAAAAARRQQQLQQQHNYSSSFSSSSDAPADFARRPTTSHADAALPGHSSSQPPPQPPPQNRSSSPETSRQRPDAAHSRPSSQDLSSDDPRRTGARTDERFSRGGSARAAAVGDDGGQVRARQGGAFKEDEVEIDEFEEVAIISQQVGGAPNPMSFRSPADNARSAPQATNFRRTPLTSSMRLSDVDRYIDDTDSAAEDRAARRPSPTRRPTDGLRPMPTDDMAGDGERYGGGGISRSSRSRSSEAPRSFNVDGVDGSRQDFHRRRVSPETTRNHRRSPSSEAADRLTEMPPRTAFRHRGLGQANTAGDEAEGSLGVGRRVSMPSVIHYRRGPAAPTVQQPHQEHRLLFGTSRRLQQQQQQQQHLENTTDRRSREPQRPLPPLRRSERPASTVYLFNDGVRRRLVPDDGPAAAAAGPGPASSLELKPLPHHYRLEPARATTGPAGNVNADVRRSMLAVHEAGRAGQKAPAAPVWRREETAIMSQRRRDEIRRQRDLEERQVLVLRLDDFKEWCQRHEMLIFFLTLNLTLAAIFYRLLSADPDQRPPPQP